MELWHPRASFSAINSREVIPIRYISLDLDGCFSLYARPKQSDSSSCLTTVRKDFNDKKINKL